MDKMKRYLDQIKAEDDLKERTKAFVTASIADRTRYEKNKKTKTIFTRERFIMKRTFAAAVSVAMCALIALFGYYFYNRPVNYISVDINPSIELGLNMFNTVVRAEGLNEDGTELLEGLKLRMLNVEQAVSAIVQEASEHDYIAGDGSTVIAVTAGSNSEDTALMLQTRSVEGVQLALSEGECSAVIYSDCMDLEVRTEAREMGISPGKYKLILMMQTMDPDISAGQYKDSRITEIMAKANEMIQQQGPDEEQSSGNSEAYGKISDTVNMVQEAKGNIEQNKNSEQEQNDPQETGTSEEETEQNQNQGEETQNKEQEQNQNQDEAPSNSQQETNQNQDQEQNSSAPEETSGSSQGEGHDTNAPEDSGPDNDSSSQGTSRND